MIKSIIMKKGNSMKKCIIIVICLSMILVGCQNHQAQDTVTTTIAPTEPVTKNTGDTDNKGTKGEPGLTLDTEWSSKQEYKLTKQEYTDLTIKPKTPAYTIAKDLSNIENINQFSGFTKEQISMLVNNGFLVLPGDSNKMFYIYDNNEYQGIPSFITTDTVLHLYHMFYEKSLMNIESNYLYKDLDLMTKQLLDKSIKLFQQLEEEQLKELQRNNVVYFLVARMLMLQSTQIDVTVDNDLLDMATKEYNLITQAEGLQVSPLYQIDFDYSQFTVRGYYTRSEELSKFFKVMMWFGTAPLSFIENEEYQYDNVLQALLITYMTFAASDTTCDAELWSNIYLPTSEYVGVSDDIDVFTMNNLRKKVFADQEDPNCFNDEQYYDNLYKEVQVLPQPQIQANLDALTTPTGKQFRFMGQRYVLDSDILQELIDNQLRPIPSSLDVMGVLGSNVAEDLLFNVYKPQETWEGYTERYKNFEKKVSEYSNDIWNSNLYNGWIWTLKSELTEYGPDSGMPYFMTTKAWKYKTLNTALGSYAELKHDTVLYGKQAMAEMGGPLVTADQHYVEPNLAVYHRLSYLMDYTTSVLEDKGMLNETLLEAADQYKELLKLLIDCTKKELNNEPLSAKEKKQLLWYGGTMEEIANSLTVSMTGDNSIIANTEMLVSDISTYANTYLSVGTGYFDDIYVVVPVEGKLYLARGSVYSFYEFTGNERLTDEKWWEMQGIHLIKHEEFGEYYEFGEVSKDLPKQPDWIWEFKSKTNQLEITSLEVLWERLQE